MGSRVPPATEIFSTYIRSYPRAAQRRGRTDCVASLLLSPPLCPRWEPMRPGPFQLRPAVCCAPQNGTPTPARNCTGRTALKKTARSVFEMNLPFSGELRRELYFDFEKGRAERQTRSSSARKAAFPYSRTDTSTRFRSGVAQRAAADLRRHFNTASSFGKYEGKARKLRHS